MTRRRNLIIILAVLVVLAGVITAEKLIAKHEDKINTVDEVVLAIDPDSITEASWTTADGSLDFVQADSVWSDASDAAFPISEEAVADFLSAFEEVHASFIIEDVEDYSQYGLDTPTCTLSFTTADGTDTVKLGGFSTMDSKRYIDVGDGKVYLVDIDPMDAVSVDRDTFMANDAVPDYSYVSEITVSGSTSLDIVRDEDTPHTYSETYTSYDISTGEYRPLSDTLLSTYKSTITGLDLTEYETYTASEDDMSLYGLDNPLLTITLKGTVDTAGTAADLTDDEEQDVTFSIGSVTTPAASDDEEDTVDGYLRFEGSEIVYHLDSDAYAELAGGTYDTLRPTEVLSVDWTQVTGMEVTMEGETHSVTLSENTDEDTMAEQPILYTLDGQDADLSAFTAAADALSIDTFSSETPGSTRNISVTVYLNNTEYPSVTFALYQYDGDSCLCTFGDETVGLLPRSQMVDLTEALTSALLNLNQTA